MSRNAKTAYGAVGCTHILASAASICAAMSRRQASSSWRRGLRVRARTAGEAAGATARERVGAAVSRAATSGLIATSMPSGGGIDELIAGREGPREAPRLVGRRATATVELRTACESGLELAQPMELMKGCRFVGHGSGVGWVHRVKKERVRGTVETGLRAKKVVGTPTRG